MDNELEVVGQQLQESANAIIRQRNKLNIALMKIEQAMEVLGFELIIPEEVSPELRTDAPLPSFHEEAAAQGLEEARKAQEEAEEEAARLKAEQEAREEAEREEKERRERVIAEAAKKVIKERERKEARIRMNLTQSPIPFTLLVNRTGLPGDELRELLNDMDDVVTDTRGISLHKELIGGTLPPLVPEAGAAQNGRGHGLSRSPRHRHTMKDQQRQKEERLDQVIIWLHDQPDQIGCSGDCAADLQLDRTLIRGDFVELERREIFGRTGKQVHSREAQTLPMAKRGRTSPQYRLAIEIPEKYKKQVEAGLKS